LFRCPTPCETTFACGHPCPGSCGRCNKVDTSEFLPSMCNPGWLPKLLEVLDILQNPHSILFASPIPMKDHR
jgi:hypothetical protein